MSSYGEVLEKMQKTFQELAGFSAEDASDLGIRLKVLAGEIYSLMSNVEWLKNQMFPQTAQKEYLEMHAVQRGLARKGAVCSAGTLVFGRSSPLPYEVLIPKGTVCAAPGAGVSFLTTQEVVLPAGQLTVAAGAFSQEGGRQANTAANTITLLLTPPAGIETVNNPQLFTGGADSETDDELRRRLLQSYTVVPNGTNAEFYRSYVAQFEGIQSASVVPRTEGKGTVTVYAAAKGAAPPLELLNNIQQELNVLREVNVEVAVKAAELERIPVSLYIEPAPRLYTGCGYRTGVT